jgi:cytochrome P450
MAVTDATLALGGLHARGENSHPAAPPAGRPRVVPPVPARPAGPMPLWRVILQLRRNALGTWGEPAYELDLLSGPFLGRKSLMVNAPEGIRRVLVDNHANYGRTPATLRILHPMIGDGLFLAEGEAWRHQRRLVAPAFAPRSLAVVARHVAAVAGEAVADLRSRTPGPVDLLRTVQRLALEVAGRALFSQEMRRHGPDLRSRTPGPVDLLRTVQRLALEVAGRALFSQEMRRHGPDLRAGMEHYGRRHARPSVLDFVLPADTPDPISWARRRAGQRFKDVLDRIIAERAGDGRDPDAPPRDLFDVLVAARDPDSGRPFTADQLRDQIATLIIAGHETTGLTLFWAFYLLAIAPDWQERVAAEAAGVDLAPEAAHEAYERLPVTRAVVNEALRLYPPAYSIVRVAKGPDEVMGEEVPPGSLVVISPWVLHRHRNRWHDPDAFDPSRFLPGAPPPDRFAYLPFGIGPRVCVGAQFALVEAALLLAALARAFRVELPGSKRVLPVAVVTTAPERAPVFRLVPRG